MMMGLTSTLEVICEKLVRRVWRVKHKLFFSTSYVGILPFRFHTLHKGIEISRKGAFAKAHSNK